MFDVPPSVQQYGTAAVAVLLTTAFLAYKFATHHYGHWKKLGVPHDPPTALFGNMGDIVMGRKPLYAVVQSHYDRYGDRPYFGMYEARKPALVVRDPELVHTLMIKDFGSFHDRNAEKESFEHDKLFHHLVNLRGERWKAIRSKLSPTFSAAKLKSMLSDINVCSSRLLENLNRQITRNNGTMLNEPIELK